MALLLQRRRAISGEDDGNAARSRTRESRKKASTWKAATATVSSE
jgi:hypothetical protein